MDFEELGKKLKKFSQDTVTEVQKMNEVRQLNGKISDEKKLLNRLYLEMGQKLYDTYKDVELPLEEFDSDFRKIRERYVAIDLLQEKIRNVKGVVLCPCCNMEVAAGDRYCTNCGNKMPETVKLEETTDEDAVEVESTVVEPEAESEEGESEKAEDAVEQTESAAEEAVCEAAEETGACARSAHQEETVATDELAADAEAAVEEAEEETEKEAAESTSEE
ncbi:MAG: zinc ribbon domain-containing protein [Lachnospiraceae bacterium]|nr:zinc ribbon domain-containing protein [Lachnospiraceae bacterium]